MNDGRPSPDALLAAAEREKRGRLKIFLGAAPGVGKTYEMLQSGRAKKADGVDVVIGVVETHGRKETEALVSGFEIVQPVETDYAARKLMRRWTSTPSSSATRNWCWSTSYAHSNAAGSRHPKRYLDVEELLSRGIDVYTTSTCSMSKASTTWWRRSPGCGCARRCRIRSSTGPTISRSSTSRRRPAEAAGMTARSTYRPRRGGRPRTTSRPAT
jgi:hypothetical protein